MRVLLYGKGAYWAKKVVVKLAELHSILLKLSGHVKYLGSNVIFAIKKGLGKITNRLLFAPGIT